MKLKQTTIQPIGKSFVNTVYFTIIVTLSEVVISCLAGYALSRLQFRGRKTIQYSLPVSYTHLDVYKRQVRVPCFSRNSRRPSGKRRPEPKAIYFSVTS